MNTNFFHSLLTASVRNRINLAMLCLAVATGLCVSWWWGLVGLFLWAVMVIIVVGDPTTRMAQKLENRAPLAQRFQGQFQKVERIQISIFNTINCSDPKILKVLRPVQRNVNNLIAHTHNFCQRMTVLENHRLVSESTETLRKQIDEIERNLNDVKDQVVIKEYLESKTALNSRIKDMEIIEIQLSRTDSQIVSLITELNRALTDIVRIQALSPGRAKEHISRITDTINQQLKELKSFEQEISQLQAQDNS